LSLSWARNTLLGVTKIKISAGKAYEVMHDDRRDDVTRLSKQLRDDGYKTELEIVEYVPGRVGLGPFEVVSITIGTIIGTKVLENVVDDLYVKLKKWAIERYEHRKASGGGGRGVAFTIYNRKGKVLRQWNTHQEEHLENEDDEED
jgi:hypothetical protein